MMKPASPSSFAFGCCLFWLLVAATVLPSSAQAQATKIFVASFGNDLNDGSRGSPKRNFQAAHDAVAAGGEVVALDTAGYGTLTITKSVGITAPAGITGFITATGPNAIFVNATSTDTVTLRGLTLTSAGANTGINVSAVGTLVVNSCVISGFTGANLNFSPSSAATLLVRNSTSRDAGSLILVSNNTAAAVKVVIDGCRLEAGSSSGFFIGETDPLAHRITIRDTVITGCNSGILVGGSSVRIDLQRCTLSANTKGIDVQISGTTVKVDNCVVTNNTTGLSRAGGTSLLSRLNNTVENNGTEGTFSGNYTAK